MKTKHIDTYQLVTDRIVKGLESGTIPWRKTWQTQSMLPVNYYTGKP